MPYMPGVDMSGSDVNDVIHFFFLLDASGSMSGQSILTLNEAMANVLNEVCYEADKKEVTPVVHVLSFNNSITWLCGTTATHGVDAHQLSWNDIGATGGTNTAGAIDSILEGLSRRHLGHHTYPPIIILITDGYSNDASATSAAIKKLTDRQKSIRIAVGVNGYNPTELEAFASMGTVNLNDGLGNVTDSTVQRLIFPVDQADKLAQVISDAAVSSLISSRLMGPVSSESGSLEEDPASIVINQNDPDWI